MTSHDWRQISRFEGSDDSPGFLLWRTHLSWRRKIEEKLALHALTHVQFVLLAGLGYLTKAKKVVTQVALAKFTYCDANMTSQVLRGLEKKGLITRIHRKGDQRAKFPVLTPEGLEKLKEAMEDVESADMDFFGVLGKHLVNFQVYMQQLLAVD